MKSPLRVRFKIGIGLSDLVWVDEDGGCIGEVVWLMGFASVEDMIMVVLWS